jgi:hypothetical protein
MKSKKKIEKTDFKWDMVSEGAKLPLFTIADILNKSVNMDIDVARNIYKREILTGEVGWYNEFEIDAISSLWEYLIHSEDEEKEVVYSEVKRYMKANIFYHMPSKYRHKIK